MFLSSTVSHCSPDLLFFSRSLLICLSLFRSFHKIHNIDFDATAFLAECLATDEPSGAPTDETDAPTSGDNDDAPTDAPTSGDDGEPTDAPTSGDDGEPTDAPTSETD